MDDLRNLAAFQCVLQSGNLSQAARRLGIPKSTLSRRIRHMEDAVGQVLIRRESKRLIPTEAGELLAQYAQRILALADQAQESLRDLGTEVNGELLIYADNAMLRAWLADLVQGFMARHPGVRLRLKSRIEAPTVDHHSQLHLWLGRAPAHGFRQELLGLLRVGVYANPSYLSAQGVPRNLQDLQRHLWVRMEDEEGRELRLQDRLGRESSLEVRAALEVDQLILLGDALARGMGIGLLPHWLAQLRIRAHPGSLERCLLDWEGEPQPLWLFYPHGHLPRRLTAFLSYVKAQAPPEWQEPLPLASPPG